VRDDGQPEGTVFHVRNHKTASVPMAESVFGSPTERCSSPNMIDDMITIIPLDRLRFINALAATTPNANAITFLNSACPVATTSKVTFSR
jgi:hypothetical protein